MKRIVVDQYTHGHPAAVVQAHALRTAEAFASATVALLQPGDSVLDVGCGPGSITQGFKQYVGPQGRVVGMDLEPKVLEQARQVVGTKAEIMQGNAYQLPFPDQSFDVVHCHQMLQHLKDPVLAIKEMHRVCKRIVVAREVDYESWLWFPESKGMDKWKTAYRQTCRKNGANPDAGRMLKQWFAEAGVSENVDISTSTVQYYGEKSTKQFGDTWAKRVGGTQLGDQMVQYGLATRSEVEEMSMAWTEWGQSPNAMLFYVDVCAVGHKQY
ncbi:hypothetical protein BASA81_006345 [Batrachochytrium salamandrivorans]|nr:hypothetical protein BASA81_006345 [Batrachochytrium salamandrivorans]